MITAKNIHKYYGDLHVLKVINLNLLYDLLPGHDLGVPPGRDVARRQRRRRRQHHGRLSRLRVADPVQGIIRRRPRLPAVAVLARVVAVGGLPTPASAPLAPRRQGPSGGARQRAGGAQGGEVARHGGAEVLVEQRVQDGVGHRGAHAPQQGHRVANHDVRLPEKKQIGIYSFAICKGSNGNKSNSSNTIKRLIKRR